MKTIPNKQVSIDAQDCLEKYVVDNNIRYEVALDCFELDEHDWKVKDAFKETDVVSQVDRDDLVSVTSRTSHRRSRSNAWLKEPVDPSKTFDGR